MADIAPVQPLRYDPETLSRVVSPPYDVIDATLRAELAARDPHNVVHVDLPAGEGAERYQNARRIFAEWREQGVLVRDKQPSFWRYVQTFEPPGGGARIARRGFFALVRALPFDRRVVLPHERTLTGPKLDRLELSRATRATLSPQFMLYSDPERTLDADLDSGEPFADFKTDDGVRHELARVDKATAVVRIANLLADSQLLIADGHHRYETAVTLADEIERAHREGGAKPSDRGEHLFTPALLVNGDDPGLVVFPTHRLVHSLASFDFDSLLERARELFTLESVSADPETLAAAVKERRRPSLAVVGKGGRAALLTLRDDADLARHPVLGKRPGVVRDTAVALLHDGLIEHVLGVSPEAQAAKTNIKYLQDTRAGIELLESGQGQVLFVMAATPVATIRRVAEAGEVMPQKSTFFHPKVPTGLLFHTLDPTRSVA